MLARSTGDVSLPPEIRSQSVAVSILGCDFYLTGRRWLDDIELSSKTSGMLHSPRHHRLLSTCRRLRRVAVSVLLLASLWRGPLPWCHSHSEPETAADASAGLAWHVQWLHVSADNGSVVAGWHWHFVLPTDVDGDGRQDGESGAWATVNCPVSCDGRILSERVTCGSDCPLDLMWDCPSLDTVVVASSASGRGEPPESVRQFRNGVDVRLLAGVNLC